MEIETYEIEEVAGAALGTTPEVEAEALEMIERLGLDGQRKLVIKPDGDDESATEERIPYPKMSASEVAVYSARFPVHDDVAAYNMGIMPIRVLQVVEHARRIFEKVQVWHDKVRDPDPVLVGKNGNDTFLLARWGDALKQFAEIKAEALEKMKETFLAKAREVKLEAERVIASVDSLVEQKLAGEWAPLPYYLG